MNPRIRSVIEELSSYFLWAVLAVLVTLTLFQVHGTVIALSLVAVQNPATRLPGWSTDTVYGLSRLMWLILGVFWLGWVMYTLEYLREGQKYHILRERTLRLGLILLVTYAVSVIIVFLI
jgi:hypothetical protein